jgi:DNA polymerase-3 subunit epsilon
VNECIDSPQPTRLRGRYACVDLETTGADPQFARIIEIGVVLIDDGVITERWSTLVDPERPIPERIQIFTGITNEMVASAPTFVHLLDEVQRRCDSRIFAAHNAHFDHGFLREEFARAGRRFHASALCTVKLARRLEPRARVHNLDALIERYGIRCEARHRALPDAQAVADFLIAAAAAHGAARVQEEVENLLRPVTLPPQLPASLVEDLPHAPGVFRLRAADGSSLHVGRSGSIRSGVLALLAQGRSPSSLVLRERTQRIEWQRATGEWSSHLLERLWRKQNVEPSRVLRYTLQLRARGDGPVVRPLDVDQLEHCYGEFRTEAMAVRVLKHYAHQHELCLRVLGLESGEGSCIAYQLGRCRGACIGKEPLAVHELRAQMAFIGQGYSRWPFAGRAALTDAHEVSSGGIHVFDRWCYLGSANNDADLEALAHARLPYEFDPLIYRLTLKALQQGRIRARPLSTLI